MNQSKPWYKEPWPWIFMAPIAVAMVVGFTMLGVAIKTNDGLVTDDYYRQGVLYNENKSRDDLAKTLGIQGLLTMDEITGDILLTMEFGQAEPVARIEGALRSPTFARDDIRFTLTAIRPGFFQASIPAMRNGAWDVELVSADGTWRIVERIALPLAGPTHIAP
jgi:uncharacterized protein